MNPAPIPLLHGHSIPRLGLGTWPLEGDAVHEMVALALDIGYRLIDTSHKYLNEEPVGLLIFLLVPEAATQRHLEILSEIAEMLADRDLRERLKAEGDAARIHELIANWEPLKSAVA